MCWSWWLLAGEVEWQRRNTPGLDEIDSRIVGLMRRLQVCRPRLHKPRHVLRLQVFLTLRAKDEARAARQPAQSWHAKRS